MHVITKAPKNMKLKLTEVEQELDNSTMKVTDFNTLFSIMNRLESSIRKEKA